MPPPANLESERNQLAYRPGQMWAGKRIQSMARRRAWPSGAGRSPRRRGRTARAGGARARGLALAALCSGLLIVTLAQRLAPLAGPPLYDGVVVTAPYRWLSPPPGQPGGAQGASGTTAVHGDSPVVALATPEEPPQAQIFAAPGTLVLPPGTTSLKLSIEPIRPDAPPPGGAVAGNEYRILVTNQAGAAVAGRAGGDVSIVIRGPAYVAGATIEKFAAGTWQPLPTDTTGLPATFLAVVTDLGDFALVVPAAATPPPPARPVPPAKTPSEASSPAAGGPRTPVFSGTSSEPRGGSGARSAGAAPTGLGFLPLLVAAALAAAIGAGLVAAARRARRRR